MAADALRRRTKTFAISVVHFCRRLARDDEGFVVRRQLLRAATGVAANYRAVCRARSDAEFIAKLGTVIEECDDASFWLELVDEIQLTEAERVSPLLIEADELIRIFAASRETVRRRLRRECQSRSVK
jgi:four helix bundle protein